MVRIFFSKNRRTANTRVKKLNIKGKVRLNKKQIKHISNWKTWKVVKK